MTTQCCTALIQIIMLQIETFVNRPIDENTYVVSDPATREAMIVDCGALFPDDQEAIADYIRREGLTVRLHVLTHGHFDHMFGAQWVADTYGVQPTLHSADTEFYTNAVAMVSAFFHRPISFPVPPIGETMAAGSRLQLGGSSWRVIHTPGHTPGGCCLYCVEQGILFSGDSIFRGSIGRTDMQGGDHRALVEALQNNVLTLPDGVKIYPGHGPATTVDYEKVYNPYIV